LGKEKEALGRDLSTTVTSPDVARQNRVPDVLAGVAIAGV
jgi:hypothetical protein